MTSLPDAGGEGERKGGVKHHFLLECVPLLQQL